MIFAYFAAIFKSFSRLFFAKDAFKIESKFIVNTKTKIYSSIFTAIFQKLKNYIVYIFSFFSFFLFLVILVLILEVNVNIFLQIIICFVCSYLYYKLYKKLKKFLKNMLFSTKEFYVNFEKQSNNGENVLRIFEKKNGVDNVLFVIKDVGNFEIEKEENYYYFYIKCINESDDNKLETKGNWYFFCYSVPSDNDKFYYSNDAEKNEKEYKLVNFKNYIFFEVMHFF